MHQISGWRVARLIREHRPRWIYGTCEACERPDHTVAAAITRAAVFLACLGQWDRVAGAELLGGQEPWAIDRLFFPHCKMEPAWSDIAFAVDVSEVYDLKRQALAVYGSIFKPTDDRLRMLYEAEDACFGRLLGVAYAEPFRSASPLPLEDLCVVLTGVPRMSGWSPMPSVARPEPWDSQGGQLEGHDRGQLCGLCRVQPGVKDGVGEPRVEGVHDGDGAAPHVVGAPKCETSRTGGPGRSTWICLS
jgi:hypothetical protein